tara:strand:- start:4345 stop:4932 length:588 start_codon:yes stop_codon:yes gene_type:complete
MTDNTSNKVLNDFINNVLYLLNSGKLFADTNSVTLGKKSTCIIENNITKGINDNNLNLIELYKLFSLSSSEQKLELKKIQISDNGERSYDVQIFLNLMLNNVETPSLLYLNITKGSDKVQRITRRANKVTNTAKDIYNNLEANKNILTPEQLHNMTLDLEKKKKIVEEANLRVQKAVAEQINNFWIRKFQLMFLL